MMSFFWTRNASAWMAVLYIALGIPLLIFPSMSVRLFSLGLAVGAIIYAMSRLWRYSQGKKDGYASTGDMVVCVLFCIVGLFCLLLPKVLFSILPITLGIILLVDGIGKLPVLMEAKREGFPMGTPMLLSTIVPLVLGIILIANPFRVTKLVIMFFGIALIADGICDLSTVFYARSRNR